MAKLGDAILTRVAWVQNYILDYTYKQVFNIWAKNQKPHEIEQS
jgi:hypothetical protein